MTYNYKDLVIHILPHSVPSTTESQFGENWETKIRKIESMKGRVPIKDLIIYMVDETDKVMKGTKYDGQGLFYHDALSQLCSNETVEWIEKNGYYHR